LSFLFFVFFLPELKGRSLEEVDELFTVSCCPGSEECADDVAQSVGLAV